jgi:hypothetical protein
VKQTLAKIELVLKEKTAEELEQEESIKAGEISPLIAIT